MYGDVCLRVLCRFAFWKTLFSIALFSALLSQGYRYALRPLNKKLISLLALLNRAVPECTKRTGAGASER